MGLPPSDLLHYGPHFMSFVAKSYYRNLRYNRKMGYFGLFWALFAQFGPNENFFRKIGLRHFCALMDPRLHAKYQKNRINQFWEKGITGRTDRRTDGQTDKGEFIGHLRLELGDQKNSGGDVTILADSLPPLSPFVTIFDTSLPTPVTSFLNDAVWPWITIE